MIYMLPPYDMVVRCINRSNNLYITKSTLHIFFGWMIGRNVNQLTCSVKDGSGRKTVWGTYFR